MLIDLDPDDAMILEDALSEFIEGRDEEDEKTQQASILLMGITMLRFEEQGVQ